MPQSSIDAAVFECAKNPARKLRQRECAKHKTIIEIDRREGVRLFLFDLGGSVCVEVQALVAHRFLVDEIVADRKRIARVDILGVVKLPDLSPSGPQDRAAALVCAKLDLPGSVCCQDFIESEI